VDGAGAAAGGPAVTYARAGAVGLVRMCRPDNRNGMTAELLDGFADAIAAARADRDARAVVVTGSGASFSAGADLKGSLDRASPGEPVPRVPPGEPLRGGVRGGVQRGGDELSAAERSFAMYVPFLAVLDLEVPVIAAMNGHAIGGGFGLALACDIRIAARGARYGANFCRLGLAPGMGISYLLPRVVGASRAAELIYGGELVDGERAVAIGLASEAVAADEVLPRALALATRIAENAPLAVRASKALLREGLGWQVADHARREAVRQAETVATHDASEGVAALLERRTPSFRGE
jgi:enoyl-CoA hydratase/carnithine racemase